VIPPMPNRNRRPLTTRSKKGRHESKRALV
jgi:hypothetical protein